MCGIAGLISGGGNPQTIVDRMIATIPHRGPDDSGTWIDAQAGVALGHRRLSIVDLSPHGHQPMVSRNGRYVLTFNGEIYNHVAVREQLDLAGARPAGGWRGHSDTETLVEAIAVWGLDRALASCVGMFAFGLWDCSERKLSLVRDRFGEKPLYYGWVGNDLLFGSELKALRAHPNFDNAVAPASVETFLARTYIPAPLSIYRHVFKLEPGCVLEVTPEAARQRRADAPSVGVESGGLKLRRYWSYADVVAAGCANPITDEKEALDLLDLALATAVRGQAMADVPVGAFLSGGIDSSTVVAMYQRESSRPVRSFTIGFNEAGFDEAADARKIARHLGTVHEELYVSAAEARDVIPLLPDMFDEPFGDSSQIPTFLVSRFARQHVTVALTGDGADEMFAGYRRYATALQLWERFRRLPGFVRAAAGTAASRMPPSLWALTPAFGRGRNRHIGGKIHKALRLAGAVDNFDDLYCSMLHQWPYETSPTGPPSSPSAGFAMDPGCPASDAQRMLYCDAMSYLPDDILCKVDRASMAVSLETRVPFLDHRVAELAARIPLSMKMQNGKGKTIVRKLLARHLPPELFDRPKTGFSLPVGEWLKGPLRPWAEDLLDPKRMAADGWMDEKIVQRRWHDHLSGARNSTQAIWSVLMFQAWLRRQTSSR
ncbi:MAG: asparagine synthase (glutamine-hydrolyzing) [Sphingomicrobium sp.]